MPINLRIMQDVALSAMMIALAASFFAPPAEAQQPATEMSQPHMGYNLDSPAEESPSDRAMVRQEFREEMEKLRDEHDELDARHDQLRVQCLNAKGDEHMQCQHKWDNLREQRDALHARVKALHERMEAMRDDHTPMAHNVDNK